MAPSLSSSSSFFPFFLKTGTDKKLPPKSEPIPKSVQKPDPKQALRKEVETKQTFNPIDLQQLPSETPTSLKVEPPQLPEPVAKEISAPDNKQIANRQQMVSKQVANREQIVSKQVANGQQIVSKTDSKIRTENAALNDYRKLVGNEKNVLYFLFHECLREGSFETSELPIRVIANHTNTSTGTAKNVIHRLNIKSFIKVVDRQRGRGGWSRYGISKELYQALQTEDHFREADPKQIAKQVAKQIAIGPSSSRDFNLNKSTNSQQAVSLPNEWVQIQTPQSVKAIGFGKSHVVQVYKTGMFDPLQLESTLEHFAYDLDRGAIRAQTGPLNMLMGILIKNQTPYVSEKLMGELKKARDESKKLMEEYQALQETGRDVDLQENFDAWWPELSQEQKNQVAPPNQVAAEGSDRQRLIAWGVFKEQEGNLELGLEQV